MSVIVFYLFFFPNNFLFLYMFTSHLWKFPFMHGQTDSWRRGHITVITWNRYSFQMLGLNLGLNMIFYLMLKALLATHFANKWCWGNSVEAPWVQLPSARDGCHQAWYPPAVTSSLISGRQCNIWCPAYCTNFQLHITHRDRMRYSIYLGKMEDRWETYSQRHRVHFSWYQEGGGAMVPVTDDHLPSLPNSQLHR